MKSFDIPVIYRSTIISKIKQYRKKNDPLKKDFSPTILDFGPVKFAIARHFGFCYGVENAIEISYKAIEENPGKRIFLLSEMIHNPEVNRDLVERGIQFLMDTFGNPLMPFDELKSNDIVIIPAFGTTIEIENILQEKGIEVQTYNTTCPFVTKVWKRSYKLGQEGYAIVIHGKARHEETRATFSHSTSEGPSIIVRDLEETKQLAAFIKGELSLDDFEQIFKGKYSDDFNPTIHLNRLGVVNQTTMLATETQEISNYLKKTLIEKFGEENAKDHFADTRDTLCYATNDNQRATYGLLEKGADIAIVVGGYNSSNTSHIVELCEEKMPSYFINHAKKIEHRNLIHHFDLHTKNEISSTNFLPDKTPITIILTCGASCPDATIEQVMLKLLDFFPHKKSVNEVMDIFNIN